MVFWTLDIDGKIGTVNLHVHIAVSNILLLTYIRAAFPKAKI